MYTTSVVCLVSGMWGSMVCGVEVGGMWRELVCGDKCSVGEGRSTVCWVMSMLCADTANVVAGQLLARRTPGGMVTVFKYINMPRGQNDANKLNGLVGN